METYTAWANVPENLKTKTGLKEMGLKPAKDQEPVAIFHNKFAKKKYKLYDVAGAVERPPATERQLTILARAREKIDRLRTCPGYPRRCEGQLTLDEYGYRKRNRVALFKREKGEDISGQEWQYVCRFCHDRDRAIEWARGVLADEKAVILDTETTGLDEDAEIIEIAIINTKGETLFNSLINPHGPMGATHIHGITEAMAEGAPSWLEIDSEILATLQAASRVVVYNAVFDSRMIDQSRGKWGLPDLIEIEPLEKVMVDMEGSSFSPPDITWQCAMQKYAEFVGDWSDYHHSYRWQRLEGGGHRALGDCRACLEYIKRMAESEEITNVTLNQ